MIVEYNIFYFKSSFTFELFTFKYLTFYIYLLEVINII